MKFNAPIIKSIVDTDLYKLTQGQLVFHKFPEAIVAYQFTNRGKTEFPPGFADELIHQIKLMSLLRLSFQELEYLQSLTYFKPTYLEWLMGFTYNPSEVFVCQADGDLVITITGPWYRTILWEVPLMALISELFFLMTGTEIDNDWYNRMTKKAITLSTTNHRWSDFGTRRRFSKKIQESVVYTMRDYHGFLGTSNVYLAMKYRVKPIGTMAHEFIMGLSAKFGVKMANLKGMEIWSDFYRGQLGIILPDTFTTDVFLRDFDGYYARLFDGPRQDSGDPEDWADNKILPHYNKLGIAPRCIVFSDNLNPEKFIELSNKYRSITNVIGGIGTNLTNDVGAKPLNMVIKMVAADFGQGWVDVVKLSDSQGKYTGNPKTVELVKRELGIV